MPRSLRSRITALATLAVAVVMVLGSFAFHAALAAGLHDAAERAAETRLDELAARVETQGAAAVTGLEDDLVQLVDGTGRVVAASEDADEGALPARDGAGRYDGDAVIVVSDELDDDLVLRLAVTAEDGDTLALVAGLLAVSTVLVTALVAAVSWWVVGRALRPVSRIRTEVDGITADRLDRRVGDPGSGDEIAALAATMNRMLDRLDAAALAQRRFVSDASHELRSPLATMRQHAELAQVHPDAVTAGELADVVIGEGARMQGLVDGLLLLARLDENAPARHDPVDLDDLALAEVSRLRAAGIDAAGGGISAARVVGDARLLGQVVRNLADNAARHARGRVAVAVGRTGDRATLTVDDDGAGIAEAERERVFDRFVRLDEARARDAGGSGLGLAIVHGIVSAAGGTVAVTTSPWGGARFTVTLPAAPEGS